VLASVTNSFSGTFAFRDVYTGGASLDGRGVNANIIDSENKQGQPQRRKEVTGGARTHDDPMIDFCDLIQPDAGLDLAIGKFRQPNAQWEVSNFLLFDQQRL